jgi:hypothetical protein
MTSASRAIAITITAILLMHIGGMAVDPIALHASPPEAAAHHAGSHHAGHGEVSTDDLATVQSAWSCMEGEGIATSPRPPLPVIGLVAVLPAPLLSLPHVEAWTPRHWSPPPREAAELRAFLQVFLN